MKIPKKDFVLAKTYFRTNLRNGGFELSNDSQQELNVANIDRLIARNQWVNLIKVLRTIGGYSLKEAKDKVDACRTFETVDRLAMWKEIMDTIDKYNEIVVEEKEEKKTKVVVCVSGGTVQAIFSNDPDIVVEMIDHDNLKEEGKDVDERTKVYENATEGMTQIY
jgi:hypothetical protein